MCRSHATIATAKTGAMETSWWEQPCSVFLWCWQGPQGPDWPGKNPPGHGSWIGFEMHNRDYRAWTQPIFGWFLWFLVFRRQTWEWCLLYSAGSLYSYRADPGSKMCRCWPSPAIQAHQAFFVLSVRRTYFLDEACPRCRFLWWLWLY